MSEYKPRHAKKTAPEEENRIVEAAETVEEEVKEAAQEVIEEAAETAEEIREEGNELRSEIEARQAAAQPQAPKKKGVSTGLVIVLLVIAIALGGAAGWYFSRGGFNKPAAVPEGEVVNIENVEVGEVEWIGDGAFKEDLTSEEVDALSDLAGLSDSVEWDEVSPLANLEDFDFGAEGETVAVEPQGEPVVVAEFDGGQIMSDEAAEAFNEAYTVTMLFGGNPEDVTMEGVLHDLVGESILMNRAAALRDQLTEEEKAAFKAEAEESYNDYKAMVVAELVDEGTDAAAAEAQVEAELKANGFTAADMQTELENTELSERLLSDIVSKVNVGEAEVKAAYDERLAAQKADFEAVPDDFEWAALNGDIITYNLPGYRAVQVLSIYFDEDSAELAGQLSDLIASGDETAAEAQESLDALYQDLEDRAKSCKELCDSGESDFESVLVQYGEDEGMTDPDMRERGYYIGETSLFWSDAVTKAVGALANPGDITDVLRTPDGVVIMRYIGEVPAGEVPLENVRSGLETEALILAQEDAREKQIDEWMSEANVKYYLERMQ